MKFFTTSVLWGLYLYIQFHSISLQAQNDTIQFGNQQITFPTSYWNALRQEADNLISKYNQCKSCENILPFMVMSLPLIEQILAEKGLPREMKYLAFFHNPTLLGDNNPSQEGMWQLRSDFYIDLGLKSPQNKKVDERWNIHETTSKIAEFIKKENAFFNNILLSMVSLEISLHKLKDDLFQFDASYYHKYAEKKEFYINPSKQSTHFNFIHRYLSFSLFIETLIHEKASNFSFVLREIPVGQSVPKFIRENIKKEDKDNFLTDNFWIKKYIRNLPDDKVYYAVIRQEFNNNPYTFLFSKCKNYNDKKEKFVENNNIDIKNKEEIKENINETNNENQGEEYVSNIPEKITPQPIKIQHTVQKGETLYSISRKYDVPITSLREKNVLRNINIIFIGQILLIQEENLQRGNNARFYKVSQEKNIFNIVKMFDITTQQLAQWNNISENATLLTGQMIKIGEKNIDIKKNKITKIISFTKYSNRNIIKKKSYFLKNNLKIINKFYQKLFFQKIRKKKLEK